MTPIYWKSRNGGWSWATFDRHGTMPNEFLARLVLFLLTGRIKHKKVV